MVYELDGHPTVIRHLPDRQPLSSAMSHRLSGKCRVIVGQVAMMQAQLQQ